MAENVTFEFAKCFKLLHSRYFEVLDLERPDDEYFERMDTVSISHRLWM
jgi:hypothetical protein